MSEKSLDTRLFCARRSGTSRSFGPPRAPWSHSDNQSSKNYLARAAQACIILCGAGMHIDGSRESIMEIPDYPHSISSGKTGFRATRTGQRCL